MFPRPASSCSLSEIHLCSVKPAFKARFIEYVPKPFTSEMAVNKLRRIGALSN